MKLRLEYFAAPVFLLSLAYCSWGWGGASLIKDIGPTVSAAAQREAPIVAAYIWIGARSIRLLGSEGSATALAEERFGPARERLLSEPLLAMENMFSEEFSTGLSWLVRVHWIAPISLLVFLFALWRRPQQVKTIRRANGR